MKLTQKQITEISCLVENLEMDVAEGRGFYDMSKMDDETRESVRAEAISIVEDFAYTLQDSELQEISSKEVAELEKQNLL